MKDIVKFCGKTIEETEKSIDETQIKLKQNVVKDEYDTIQNNFQINEKATKKTLQQPKFKKCKNLPQKQLTFKKTMKTGCNPHTLKLLLVAH